MAEPLIVSEPGPTFWRDFRPILEFDADAWRVLLDVLRDAADPDDPETFEDVIGGLAPAIRVPISRAPSMLRFVVETNHLDTAEGAEVFDLLLAVASSDDQTRMREARSHLIACWDILQERKSDLALSDLRVGVFPALRALHWEVALAVATSDDGVVGYLPRLQARMRLSDLHAPAIFFELDETALATMIDGLREAQTVMQKVREAGGTAGLRLGGPFSSTEDKARE